MSKKLGNTRVERRTVSQLVREFQPGTDSTVRLQMPAFQRGIVWSREKQSELIRSLKRGFPVGSLLFYKRPEHQGGYSTYLLIDGLQRTTAIRNYQVRPLEYTEVADLQDSVVDGFITAYIEASGSDIGADNVKSAIQHWMRDTGTLDIQNGFDATGLIMYVKDHLNQDVQLGDNSLLSAARGLVAEIDRECDISGIEIPVLLYEGDEEHLPLIFERINTQGTTLTKYEIYAASWVDQETHVQNEKVKDAIRNRYFDMLSNDNIDIDGVRQDGTPNSLSLFDYLFGLGKHLVERFPRLFRESSDRSSMEAVAFSLATVVHGRPLSRMRKLPEFFERTHGGSGKVDPTQFEEAVLEAAEFVDATLKPYISLKLNSSRMRSAHTELQITSMIARVACAKYLPATWEERPEAVDELKALRQTLPQHYLVDVLLENWRGSGDSRLFEWVWERDESGKSGDSAATTPSRRYLQHYSRERLNSIFDQWFEDQVQLRQRSRAYVTASARAFLRFVYADIVTVKEEGTETFELDHVFPVSRLVNSVPDSDEGWPISAVSNLALFDWRTNREKSKLDLVQYLDRLDGEQREVKRVAVERFLMLPVSEAVIPRDETGDDVLDREYVEDFIRQRFQVMKERAIETLSSSLS